jgi:hypothetical protein
MSSNPSGAPGATRPATARVPALKLVVPDEDAPVEGTELTDRILGLRRQ